jgi:chemotaxis protein histidine kinase CheA
LNYEDLGDLSLESRDAISNDNQVSEARSIVIEESTTAIGLVERAISAYIKSDFDSSHIAHLPQLMNSVRGAFEMMDVAKLPEVTPGAASLLNEFVDRKRKNPNEDVQALETLADAMISIEYFLNELGRRYIADERILQVAEDSVSALKACSAST